MRYSPEIFPFSIKVKALCLSSSVSAFRLDIFAHTKSILMINFTYIMTHDWNLLTKIYWIEKSRHRVRNVYKLSGRWTIITCFGAPREKLCWELIACHIVRYTRFKRCTGVQKGCPLSGDGGCPFYRVVYSIKTVGRDQKRPLWRGVRSIKVSVNAGSTVHYILLLLLLRLSLNIWRGMRRTFWKKLWVGERNENRSMACDDALPHTSLLNFTISCLLYIWRGLY